MSNVNVIMNSLFTYVYHEPRWWIDISISILINWAWQLPPSHMQLAEYGSRSRTIAFQKHCGPAYHHPTTLGGVIASCMGITGTISCYEIIQQYILKHYFSSTFIFIFTPYQDQHTWHSSFSFSSIHDSGESTITIPYHCPLFLTCRWIYTSAQVSLGCQSRACLYSNLPRLKRGREGPVEGCSSTSNSLSWWGSKFSMFSWSINCNTIYSRSPVLWLPNPLPTLHCWHGKLWCKAWRCTNFDQHPESTNTAVPWRIYGKQALLVLRIHEVHIYL